MLEELAVIDRTQGNRDLTEDETMRATILVELKRVVKNEKASWRQKSRVLWLKRDNDTKFFQPVATAHVRYNIIDRLVVRGKEVQNPAEIMVAIIDFYKYLYTESEIWRPSFELLDSPKVSQEEQEWLKRPFAEPQVL